MQSERLIESPLNYTGGKYRLLPQILPLFPEHVDTFVDLFCGGCNVGINVCTDHVLFNDSNSQLQDIYRTFRELGTDGTIMMIKDVIKHYGLSDVSEYGYEYYGCKSSAGLAEYNRSMYLKLRKDLNAMKVHDTDYYIMLYVAIVYAFNNQIRFNSKGKFNLPVGKRDFNKKIKNKLECFVDRLIDTDCCFTSLDFREIGSSLSNRDFIYADPPYLVTTASYNENGGWTRRDETDLLSFLDRADKNGTLFALSNVLKSKGMENDILKRWCMKRNYIVHHLQKNYSNSNYQRKSRELASDEVLITNY